jgi:peptide/nickel transport system permease protein
MRVGFTPVLDNSGAPHTHASVTPVIRSKESTQ